MSAFRPFPASILVIFGLVPLVGFPAEKHWAFEVPKKPTAPKVANVDWPRNEIDRFILAKLAKVGVTPSREASRSTLVRRLHLDLTGLPPTPERTKAFSDSSSSKSYEELVDELLASPHYGERMAQDWFDLARFADTSGYAADRTRTIWPYRDWVIRAFNENMPYKQFSIEQLAGDLLPVATDEQKVASAFHRHAMQAKGNNPRKEEFRVKGIVDRLETTGRVWLGLTIECAECHDHKHDPVSQKEYYQLFAIFNNVPHLGSGYGVHGPRMKYVPRLAGRKVNPIEIPVMQEMPAPRVTHLHLRGNFKQKGEEVKPGVPGILPPLAPSDKRPLNRLAFAEWLFSKDQPLTARVVVNRIWQHHFGEGLVRTVADFGLHGDKPSHPELLDWLAVRFVESGWDVRAMHRLIVNSATYRQSSVHRADLREKDPNNRLLARFPRVRLPAEQIRDGALAVSGLLNARVGGPSVFPYQPPGLYEERGQTLPGNSNFTWKNSTGADRYRRSLYTYWKRMMLHPVMATFDAPTREVCVAKRSITNTPQQALAALNEPLFLEAADALAKRLENDDEADDRGRISKAFKLCFSRPPDEDEMKQCLLFLKQQRKEKNEVGEWAALASVLMNLDEWLTLE